MTKITKYNQNLLINGFIESNSSTATTSSIAFGVNSIANGLSTVAADIPVVITSACTIYQPTIVSACTITLSDPDNSLPAVVFNGDVSIEWGNYISNFCSEFTLTNSTGLTQSINVNCGVISVYYDIGSDKTYIVDSTIS